MGVNEADRASEYHSQKHGVIKFFGVLRTFLSALLAVRGS